MNVRNSTIEELNIMLDNYESVLKSKDDEIRALKKEIGVVKQPTIGDTPLEVAEYLTNRTINTVFGTKSYYSNNELLAISEYLQTFVKYQGSCL